MDPSNIRKEWRGRPIGSPEVDWHRAVDDLKREQERHGQV